MISIILRLVVKMLRINKLKEKISKGKPVLGAWNTLASPLVKEIFAQLKDDVKWSFDMEVRFITYQVDSSIIYNHVSIITDWFEDQVSK